ncbi:MAG: hypothetical protein QW254_04225 [Desulfurococcaceae archaeon]
MYIHEKEKFRSPVQNRIGLYLARSGIPWGMLDLFLYGLVIDPSG